jgi:zona occludens toxin
MPLNLVTGQPRNGKSLWTLWHVRALGQKENRTVYYNLGRVEKGPDVGKHKLVKIPGWVLLEEPEEWISVPDNSIVLIDEAQRAFRPRHSTKAVPEYVEKLETHGHRGLDLFFITQHPGLIEGNVLRLVQTHRHVKRLWGAHAATIHEWEDVNKNPDQSRSGSIPSTWRYPKDVFEVYESASVHTVKVRPPFRLFILLAFMVIAPCLIAYAIFRPRGVPVTPPQTPTHTAVGAAQGAKPTTAAPVLSPVEYVQSYQPRLAGLAYTAPAYDQLTTPQAAPFPVGCVESSTRCSCYTEQGTRLDVDKDLCLAIVERGYFQFWKASGSTLHAPSEKTPPLQAKPVSANGAVS